MILNKQITCFNRDGHSLKQHLHTLWWVNIHKVRCSSEHDLLQDDREAVDISFLSSIDRSSCHTQQLRCCPQLVSVKPKLAHLRSGNPHFTNAFAQCNRSTNINKKAQLTQRQARDSLTGRKRILTSNSTQGHSRNLGHSFCNQLQPTRVAYRHVILLAFSNVSKEVAIQIAKNCRHRQPHCHLTPPPRGTPRISTYALYFQKLESFGYIFAAAWVYLLSFNRCCFPNMRSSAKFRENLNLQQFKVIQGHRFWYQSKAHVHYTYQSLIVTLVLSCTVAEIRPLIG